MDLRDEEPGRLSELRKKILAVTAKHGAIRVPSTGRENARPPEAPELNGYDGDAR
jgi:hypothetical protein